MSSRLAIEKDSKEVIIVACSPTDNGNSLAAKVRVAVARAGRRASIHVISPLGRPEYIEVVRPVIQGNIGMTMCVRFEGEGPEDLRRLIETLGNGGADPVVFLVGSECGAYEALLKELEVPYEIVRGRGGHA